MEGAHVLVSLSVMAVCVILGIPLWWNTTKVYRAFFPHAKISELQAASKAILIRLNIFAEHGLFPDESSILNFERQLENHVLDDMVKVNFHLNITKLHTNGVAALMDKEICRSAFPALAGQSFLTYNIALRKFSETPSWYFCPHTLNAAVNINSVEDIPGQILSLLNIFVGRLSNSAEDGMVGNSSDSLESLSEPPSPGYDLTFTLAVSDPANILPCWDIEEGLSLFIQPLLEQLEHIGPFSVSSQVIFFTDVDVKPVRDGERFYYSKNQLSLLINALESRLGSEIASKRNLNFVVYIPPADSWPLFIRSKKADDAFDKVAFHSARWGGVYILNPFQSRAFFNVTEKPFLFGVPLADVMETFAMQLRSLFGLEADYVVSFSRHEKLYLAEFEKIKLTLSHTLLQLRTSLSTLRSLSELLGKIANIVIRDEIKDLVDKAVSNIEDGHAFLRAGAIKEAFSSSRAALEASEQAFFDSSLLALLYFPDDQKYAIYVPLFLPVALPIFMSFVKTVKFFRGSSRKRTGS